MATSFVIMIFQFLFMIRFLDIVFTTNKKFINNISIFQPFSKEFELFDAVKQDPEKFAAVTSFS